MLLTVPSSGSDWLARVLARNAKVNYYEKEFFNPICNRKHGAALERDFGCELVSCYQNIARDAATQPGIGLTIDRTWGREQYTFDKEVWSAFKIPAFVERFRCALLYRSPQQTFPPSRDRVYSWYDAIWNALREQGMVAECKPLTERAVEAHTHCWQRMFAAAAKYSIPILHYDVLAGGTRLDVRNELDCGWMTDVLDLDAAVDEIMETRRLRLPDDKGGPN